MNDAIFIELGCSKLSDLVDQMARHERNGDMSNFALCQAQAEELAAALNDLDYETIYLDDLYTNYLKDND